MMTTDVTTQYVPELMYEAGYKDLVSVIPPGAPLAPSSRIVPAMVGKVPGVRSEQGTWHGYDWQRAQHTLDEVRAWNRQGANVGMRASLFPAIDIDCKNEALAKAMQAQVDAMLGHPPVRIGEPPKRLLVCRTDTPFGRLRLWVERGEERHLVEILGDGQQYVVYGTHPKTGMPYKWESPLHLVRPEALPMLRAGDAVRLLDRLGALAKHMGYAVTREGDGSPKSARGTSTFLLAPSTELLREAVLTIPNTNELFPDRTSYLRMAYAIRAACGSAVEDGFAVFAEWASRWKGNSRFPGNDPAVVLSDWRRVHGPFSVGWPWIVEQARPHGFSTAALEFESVTPAADIPEDTSASTAPRYSDQWLADVVAQRQSARIRFVPATGKYVVWDGARWCPDADLQAEDLIKLALRDISNEVLRVAGASDKERRAANTLAMQICGAGKAQAVAQLMRSDRRIALTPAMLDSDIWLLSTPAGAVDLRTGLLRPPDADALCTRITGVPPEFGKIPSRWLQFLQEVTNGDEELIAYLKRLCGYSLTGSTEEQHLSFIWGPGGNGKGIFADVLAGVLGDYAVGASMDTFTASYGDKHTTDLAMLAGARLVTASETQAGKKWDEQRVKAMTGGDRITARFMRSDNFVYVPQFKLLIIGNHKPEIRTMDDAMKRRLQIVPFTHVPPVPDRQLSRKLREEWPAILAWMVDGCREWLDGGLAPPPIVQAATASYFDDEDSVARWLQENTVVEETATVLSADLFSSWRWWAGANNEPVGSIKALVSAVAAHGFVRWQEPGTRKRGFRGLKLKPTPGL